VTKRNMIRIVAAVLVLGYFAYGQLRPKPGAHAVPPRALLPVVPSNAKGFTLGKLAFKTCELTQRRSGATTAAYCAPFQVPENYDAAAAQTDARKIDLNVALIKA